MNYPRLHVPQSEHTEHQKQSVSQPTPLSHHAAVRCAQRGIELEVVDVILEYGRAVYDLGGGCRYFLGRTEKRLLARLQPDAFRRYGRKLDCVVVVTSKGVEKVITTFVRNRRH